MKQSKSSHRVYKELEDYAIEKDKEAKANGFRVPQSTTMLRATKFAFENIHKWEK